MHKHFKHFIAISVFIFITMVSFSSNTRASGNVLGFAWADGVGWISLSSENDHDSNTEGIQFAPYDFGLTAPAGNGPITGYAWSDNLGWIRFDGGCPDGTNSNNQDNLMLGSYCNAYKHNGEWRGFARIVNMDGGDEWCFTPASGNPDNCGATDAESASYISLSKHNDHDRLLNAPPIQKSTPGGIFESDYGVIQSAEGGLSGFAWNPLVGWIEFYPEDVDIPDSPLNLSGGGTYCPGDVIETTLSWTPQPVECSATWTTDPYPPSTSSAEITAPTVTTDYTLTCGGLSDMEQIVILDAQDAQCQNNGLSVSLESTIPEMCANDLVPVNLIYDVNNATSSTECTGSWGQDLPNTGGSVQVEPTETTSYSVTCDGETSNSVTITVFSIGYPQCSSAMCTNPTALNFGQPLPCDFGPCEDCGPGGGGGGKPIFEEF